MECSKKQHIKSVNGVLLLMILGALMAFTSLSTDIYLPAMPQMALDLGGRAELTVTGFLLGFAFAQLVWGPISDRIGRKIPLYIGMVLFVIGSIGCAMSETIEQMVFWRIFQAFGACTAPMLARAIVRDMFDKTRAVQLMSTLMIIMAIAPIGGPLLGGQLLKIGSWHTIFYLLAAIGVLMFCSLWWLPETRPQEKRANGAFGLVFRNYRQLLRDRNFMRYTLCLTFYYVGQYAFIVGSPKVYIDFFHVDPQHFGWLFGLNIAGVMLVSFANRLLVKRFSMDQLLRFATLFISLIGGLLAFFAYTRIGGIVSIIISVFGYFVVVGIIGSCAAVSALDGIPEMAGSGSALMGSLQYGSGIISSLLLAVFSDGSAWTMAWIMALFALASAMMTWRK
ncbi:MULTISPECIES: multidrug effflux MFS transporter [Pasteurellaceae]|uniref:multidrug effflux MFS transporter n=1 Tax=Pasteurellaceae TaxID=712 RepID=UPI00356927D6